MTTLRPIASCVAGPNPFFAPTGSDLSSPELLPRVLPISSSFLRYVAFLSWRSDFRNGAP